MKRRLFGWIVVRLAWWLTTHPGFYSPCDDLHCCDVRDKARAWRAGLVAAVGGEQSECCHSITLTHSTHAGKCCHNHDLGQSK